MYQVKSQDSYLKGCGWKEPNCMEYLDIYLKAQGKNIENWHQVLTRI